MQRPSRHRHEPAFVGGLPAASSHERPVDLVHLSHQTMGDAALEREVLGLLARQIASLSHRLDHAHAEERRRMAHAMKGACLNVGAFRLARAAEAFETDPEGSNALGGFQAEMAVASGFIARILDTGAAAR